MRDLNEVVKEKLDELVDNDFNVRLEEKIKVINEALTKEEIKDIINELLPDIDDMISKKVKEHFKFLVQSLQTIFND